ncbi:hypothetical protein [Gracilibacillus massiliensis]|uniref:hypothetical protein n=1 Tax=Gracilibacillus massiliensis TaxID=1564956 RepID=UPI00071D8346|nr:hypothetical protein [Gracilibacillus massiliensis]
MNEIDPHLKQRELERQLKEAKKRKDKARQKKIRHELINFYVQYGSYLKMNVKNDRVALTHLQNALDHEPDHALANYRCAHIMYKQSEFSSAIQYFQRALDTPLEPLSDTLKQISYMYMADASLKITKKALKKIHELGDDANLMLDEDKIVQLRAKLSFPEFDRLEQVFFRKVTADGKAVAIDDTQFESLYDQTNEDPNLVLLVQSNKSLFYLKYQHHLPVYFRNNVYRVLYFLLQSDVFIDNQTICIKMNLSSEHEDTNESGVRSAIRDLKADVFFWEELLEAGKMGRRAVHRRKKEIRVIFLTEAGELLPDE